MEVSGNQMIKFLVQIQLNLYSFLKHKGGISKFLARNLVNLDILTNLLEFSDSFIVISLFLHQFHVSLVSSVTFIFLLC